MLVTLKEILKIAEERKFAVGAFNAPNLESLQAVIGAAEAVGLPVIIQYAQCHEQFVTLEVIGPIMVDFAKRAKVPVCVHLDHGEDLETLGTALSIGFSSVMFDGSGLPFEDNIKNTKLAVEMAAKTGASVEAELGSMGRRESGAGDKTGSDDESKIYTDPVLAGKFVRETGIDALACSFGTTHGIYLTKPQLDFSIVASVRGETGNIPVVMHGGSGVSREEFHRAIKAGVRKINYFTYMDKAGGAAAAEYIKGLTAGEPQFFTSIAVAARAAMRENVEQAMINFSMAD